MTDYQVTIILIVSVVISYAIGLLTRWHASAYSWGLDKNHGVPRVGGLAIMASVMIITTTLYGLRMDLAGVVTGSLLIAAVGLLDDVGLGRGPLVKLIVSLFAASITIYTTGVYVSHINTPILSDLIALKPIAIVVSVFGLAGMSHAVNLIDGIHGLALSFSVIAFTAMSIIALSVGEVSIGLFSLIVACACLGLFILNFPSGSIFLGDVGSYFLGFLGAWVAIHLCHNNPEISPWAMFCIFVYPIADVSYAAVRRLGNGNNPMKGDTEHLHHRILRVTDRLRHNNPKQIIFASTLSCTLLALVPALLATLNFSSPDLLMALAVSSITSLVAINWIISVAA